MKFFQRKITFSQLISELLAPLSRRRTLRNVHYLILDGYVTLYLVENKSSYICGIVFLVEKIVWILNIDDSCALLKVQYNTRGGDDEWKLGNKLNDEWAKIKERQIQQQIEQQMTDELEVEMSDLIVYERDQGNFSKPDSPAKAKWQKKVLIHSACVANNSNCNGCIFRDRSSLVLIRWVKDLTRFESSQQA